MFICLANTPYFCYNDIVYFDERGYLLIPISIKRYKGYGLKVWL